MPNLSSSTPSPASNHFSGSIYLAAAITGLPLLIFKLSSSTDRLINSLYIGSYILFVVFAFVKLPYWLKASAMLLITYALGLSNLLETGIWGDARLFLIGFITLSIIFFSLRGGFITGLISLISITIVGWLTIGKQITLIIPLAQSDSLIAWVAGGSAFLMLSSVISVSIYSLQSRFSLAAQESENFYTSQIRDHDNLDERIKESALALDRSSEQLEAAALVNRDIAEIHDLQQLLNSVVLQITNRLGYYHAGIFLSDSTNSKLSLVAASSKGGQNLLTSGHKLEVSRESFVGFAALQKHTRIAQDVGADALYFNNSNLPETCSEIALPMITKNILVGVLDIQAQQKNAFGPEDISTLQAITDQVSMAIENNRILEQSRASITNLEALNAGNISKAWKQHLGTQVKGYSYTPMGINVIGTQDLTNENDPTSEKTIIIPLSLRGKEIGEITLKRKLNDAGWAESEKELASRIANQVALAIENARLLEDSQRRANREQTVSELSDRFSRSLDVDALLQDAVRELHKLPQVSEVSVYINPVEEVLKTE